MKVTIMAEIKQTKTGIEARSPELHLTSHALDRNEAIESLRRGVLAWCIGLQSLGKLDKAINQRQLKWESNGASVEVELILQESEPPSIINSIEVTTRGREL